MSAFRMLDVAIGMTFIFLLISLICTAIIEIIEAVIKKRAKDLEKGIREMLLGNSTASEAAKYLTDLYQHPLVYGLFEGKYVTNTRKLPSYIPARTFALALMDVVLPATGTTNSGASAATETSTTGTEPNTTEAHSLNAFRSAVGQIQSPQLKQALLTLTDAAGNDIVKVRENIENWYNNTMDRVAGWYKRRAQVILLVIGFLLAWAINADAIAVFKSLSNDSALRESVVAAAQEYAKQRNSDTTLSTTAAPQDRVKEALNQLEGMRLPIGWDWEDNSKSGASNTSGPSNKNLAVPNDQLASLAWGRKILGWFVTAIAVSLGSPFWFDLLNKFMVVRSTVKPHEKSPEESSEDGQAKKQ